MRAWSQPVIGLAVEADRDGVPELWTFRARPDLTWRHMIDLIDAGHTADAVDHIIGTCLLPDSRAVWAELCADDEVFLSPTVAQDVARHLVSTGATGRRFEEVCAFIGLTTGPSDNAAYLRGRLTLAGLDDRSPLSAVLDVVMTTMVDTPSKELEEFRDRWDDALRRPRLTVVADQSAPAAAGERQWPDRATWGLLPHQVAATERLMGSAP